MFTHIVIHYGEIALKGANRHFFEKRLADNIESKTGVAPRIEHGRLVVSIQDDEDLSLLKNKLEKIPGISWFAFCIECCADLGSIKECVLANYEEKGTVKVETGRSDKSFPLTSLEVNKCIGKALEEKGFRISMNPDNFVYIEIAKNNAFVFFEKTKGVGGLPVSSSGKVLVLLSGGIDSPVAAYLMARRGCSVEFLHFHGLSSSDEVKESKITAIVEKLSEYTGSAKLRIIPFDYFHMAALSLNPRHEMVMFRRFMLACAERLAQSTGAKAIVTGDNIGQVASQTLENIAAVDSGLSVPVLRPLAGHDKNEIIVIAKEIGTLSLSLAEYKDCCSLVSKHPETKSTSERVSADEQKINMEKVIEESLKRMETIEI